MNNTSLKITFFRKNILEILAEFVSILPNNVHIYTLLS